MDKSYFYAIDDEGEEFVRTFTNPKSFDEVRLVFEGSRPSSAKKKFIAQWLESEKWKWFEDHNAWLNEKSDLEDSDFPDALLNLRSEPIYIEPSVSLVKPFIMNAINSASVAELAAIRDEYPDYEQVSWDKQEQQARSWLADNSTQTILLDMISAERGLDKTELCNRIVAKADAYESFVGTVIGKRQAKEDAVLAAGTWEEIFDILSEN